PRPNARFVQLVLGVVLSGRLEADAEADDESWLALRTRRAAHRALRSIERLSAQSAFAACGQGPGQSVFRRIETHRRDGLRQQRRSPPGADGQEQLGAAYRAGLSVGQ